MTVSQALAAPKHSIEYNLIMDLRNEMGPNSTGAYYSMVLMNEGSPFTTVVDEGVTAIIFNLHFLREVRRQLSGDSSSMFSDAEQETYDEYLEYINNGTYTDVSAALDDWLRDEVINVSHGTADINREYNKLTHPWRKLDGTNTQG